MVNSFVKFVLLILIALVDDARPTILRSDAVSTLVTILKRNSNFPKATTVNILLKVAQYGVVLLSSSGCC
jgi:hypothetical protein